MDTFPSGGSSGTGAPNDPAKRATPEQTAREANPVKIGRIQDADDGGFGFEYDDTRNRKNMMRLEALTYEGAIREARSFLGIRSDDRDDEGDVWDVE
jgi:hypothetical protein